MMHFHSYKNDKVPDSSSSVITDVALISFVLFTVFYIGYVILSMSGVL